MRAEIKSHTILDKYTALIDISCRLNSERNFEQLLKLIADEATKHLDAERATIFMLDKEKSVEAVVVGIRATPAGRRVEQERAEGAAVAVGA